MDNAETIAQGNMWGDAGSAPAGFWVRVGATLIDSGLSQLVYFFMDFAVSATKAPVLPLQIAKLLLALFYFTWAVGRWGQTFGKGALGIKIIRFSGGEISYLRAFGRYLAYIPSALLLGWGYLRVAVMDDKRGLHDVWTDTQVVYVDPWPNRKMLIALAVFGFLAPLALGLLSLKSPALSRMLQFKGEKESAHERMKSINQRVSNLTNLKNLGGFRVAASTYYYGEKHGEFPEDPAIFAGKAPDLQEIPVLKLPDHPESKAFEIYDGGICPGQDGKIGPAKLKDSGRWGYVTDRKSKCWGRVFIDCTHADDRKNAWFSY